MTADPILMIALALAHVPFAVTLGYVDVREHRLPNLLVLAVSGAVTAVGGVYCLIHPAMQPAFLAAVMIALLGALLAVILALAIPGSIGMGDAKVFYSTLMPSALLGASILVGALAWVCLVGAILAIGVLIATRGDTKARFAFGPVLLSAPYGGALLAALYFL